MKYSKKFYENQEQVQAQSQVQGQGQAQAKPSVEVIMTKTNYTNAVSKLQEIFKGQPDEKTKQWIEILQGKSDNDKITISEPKPVQAVSLLPTQNEIDFTQSLSFPLENPPTKTFEKQGNYSFQDSPKNALLIAEIGGKNYIIDGHHRWSSAYLVNPECDMNCYIMSGFKNAEEALKATQLAIAKAVGEKNVKFPFASTNTGINLLDTKVTEENFKTKVKETIENDKEQLKEEVISAFANAKKGKNQDEIANYLWKNVLFMREKNPMQSPAPKRDYMPQTGGNKETPLDPVADVINPLKAGEVNVKPSYESRIIKTYEKFIQNWKK